jgi:small subunit ribosomal protein S1
MQHNDINEISAPDWMALVLQGAYDYAQPRRGEIREAVILQIANDEIMVDLGAKLDGVIPGHDLRMAPVEMVSALRVGDRVPVAIMRVFGSNDGTLSVSLSQGLQQEDWLRAAALMESAEVVEGQVTEENRGGVVVRFGRLRGFVPNSHLGAAPAGVTGALDEIKQALIGATVPLVVIDVNQQRRRLVLSKRLAERRHRAQLLEALREGEVRSAVVRNLTDFGAFVDIGGLDGLIHVSELDWERVEHPSQLLSPGDAVEVLVLSVDRERQRIGLSRKRLLPDPWEHVRATLNEGDVISGRVTHVVSFGAFVEVGPGVEGLAHVSNMPLSEVSRDLLRSGDAIEARVISIDDDQRRIGLALLEPAPPEALDEDQALDDPLPDEGALSPESLEKLNAMLDRELF